MTEDVAGMDSAEVDTDGGCCSDELCRGGQ